MVEFLGEPLLVEQPNHLLPALPAGGVLAAAGGLVEWLGKAGGREHLDLLGLQRCRVEADRLLHRGQRQQLHEMVLDDIAGRADAVVIARAPAQADVFGHGDLYVVDVVRIPDRVEQLVGEPQRQDVLHRLFAQVVVDAEDRFLREDRVDRLVQLACAGQVVAERLLYHDSAPPVALRAGQAGLVQLLTHHREGFGRDRQVEGVVAAGAALGVELLQRLGELGERVVVVESAWHKTESLGQPVPVLLPKRCSAVLLDGVVHHLTEILGAPVSAGKPHQRECGRQQAAVGQIVDGRHHLLAGQVAGDAENHHAARAGDSG